MQVGRLGGLAVLLAAVSPVFGQWESGSDGSDGAFSPAITTVVDLSLSASLCDCDAGGIPNDPCRWDCPSPVAGRGVYDAQQWAVVFKYTTVNVPSGATITFGQHPSGAPVVWLATGNVTINGRLNLDANNGVPQNPGTIPHFARPGPGGFEGGQAGHDGQASVDAFGFGPGSSPTQQTPSRAGAASHATLPPICTGPSTGATYGNIGILPLIGGSGGNSEPGTSLSVSSGGAGGGAILIASTVQATIGATGSITAEGGDIGLPGGTGGPGSGGAVRLRADTFALSPGSQLTAQGGLYPPNCFSNPGAPGRVRIEANSITNLGTITGSQSIVNAPSVVFPAAPTQLYVTSACSQAAPVDPQWGIMSTDIDLNSGSPCTVNIEGSGMPVGTIVVVRMIPARGSIVSVNSTPMVDAGGGLRTATTSVTFPAGRAELQLRANW